MFKRPLYIFCSLALLLAGVILVLQSTWGARMKLAVGGLFLPLFGLSATLDTGVDKAGARVVPRDVLNRELEQLRVENRKLRVLGQQAHEVFLENQRMRAMLGFDPRYTTEAAFVDFARSVAPGMLPFRREPALIETGAARG